MWFPIVAPDGTDVYPIRSDGSEGRWRWGKKKLLEAVKNNNVIFEFKEDGRYVVYEKVRGQKTDRTQFTTWFQDKYVNSKGSQSLKKLFGGLMSVFDFAKPVELIYDLVFMANNRNAIVLDFFAGSRVIIMTEANSSVKSKVLKLLPKLKTEENDGLCVA
ncbi:DNA methyltransferase [Streptococcus sp.]|uniref:DNA methyltransferase n=1 Tax=Streptococcus sp. TaxID=1306 RepID=UPI0035A074B6